MCKWSALVCCTHDDAEIDASSREWRYLCPREIARGFANYMMSMTAVLVGSGRILMMGRVAHRHLAGQVCVSGACGIANRSRERRADQQACHHE
jgi:hypothetical protein